MDAQEALHRSALKCYNGKEIINPYTGVRMYVPCGVCDACMLNKSLQKEMRLNAQASVSKYCYFVTPTYETRFVPRYTITPVSSDDGSRRVLYRASSVPRGRVYREFTIAGKRRQKRIRGLCEDDIWTFDFLANSEYISKYCDKADLSKGRTRVYPEYKDSFGYICWPDIVLFMKRLRKRLSKLGSNEKIHVFTLAEYGPVSFRPHFHLLFFFNSDKIASGFVRSARSSWRFGRIDVSKSRGGASTYVAGYTNSFSKLPLHLREHVELRPRSRFSIRFGEQFFQEAMQEGVKGNFAPLLNGVSLPVDGKVKTLYPWRSILTQCFYAPASGDKRTVLDLVETLRCLRNIASRPFARNCKSRGEIIRVLYDYYNDKFPVVGLTEFFENGNDFPLCDLLRRLHINPVNAALYWKTDAYRDRICSALYRLFRDTDLFLEYHGFNLLDRGLLSNPRLRFLLQNSINFFKTRDYENVRNFCQDLATAPSDWTDFFWPQAQERVRKLKDSPLFPLVQNKLSELVEFRVKHRELNDANQIFTDRKFYEG